MKLVTILKSRYSGERQADKYRAELQIRRRKANESLSELNQDIRRLMALAYPKLTQMHEKKSHVTTSQTPLEIRIWLWKLKKKTPRKLSALPPELRKIR